MRRLIFVFIMMFFIWLLFYGQPAYVSWMRSQQSEAPVAEVAAVAEVVPSLVAQYKADKSAGAAKRYARPMQVLDAYSMALIKHEMPYSLDLFTLETRLILPRLNVNVTQMDNEALRIETCLPAAVFTNGDFAVIRFALARKECPPYFLQRQSERWRIDLMTSHEHLGFNAQDQWYTKNQERLRSTAYGFAFSDVSFDQYGYPH
jgi:hypothetical protein